VVPRERLCAIIAERHREHWRPELWSLPSANAIQQPVNRGTANGVLLSVLSILERDPLARILFLPADHYIRDERALAGALRETTTLLARNPEGMILIGIEPDAPDPELGYIVPGDVLPDGSRTVREFVEKPVLARARRLVCAGALWNSFIFAASGTTLLQMIRARTTDIVDQMETALARDSRAGDSQALAELYEHLPSVDFSHRVVQGSESRLRVIRAPACGWSDLGTPARVAATLRRLDEDRLHDRGPSPSMRELLGVPAVINLAARHLQLGFSLLQRGVRP
jgi:mannose-1-phosphate guanylyltransferase